MGDSRFNRAMGLAGFGKVDAADLDPGRPWRASGRGVIDQGEARATFGGFCDDSTAECAGGAGDRDDSILHDALRRRT
jgi:hypothetical protein